MGLPPVLTLAFCRSDSQALAGLCIEADILLFDYSKTCNGGVRRLPGAQAATSFRYKVTARRVATARGCDGRA